MTMALVCIAWWWSGVVSAYIIKEVDGLDYGLWFMLVTGVAGPFNFVLAAIAKAMVG